LEFKDDFETAFKRALARERVKDLFVRYDLSKLADHEMSVETYEYHVNQNKLKAEKERGI
jgi:hypothetical protein